MMRFSAAAALLLGLSEAGSSTSYVANMKKYPTYTGPIDVVGTVTVTDTLGDLDLELALTGLESNTTGGVHIHVGSTCENSGAHYWTPLDNEDPWNVIKWQSDVSGAASDQIRFDNGYDLAGNRYHAVVVHDSSNARVACGVIDYTPCQAFCAYNIAVCSNTSYTDLASCETACQAFDPGSTGNDRFEEDSLACRLWNTFLAGSNTFGDPSTQCQIAASDGGIALASTNQVCRNVERAEMTKYPTYDGELNIFGSVQVSDEDASTQRLEIQLSNLESNTTGGIHIHVGSTCETSGGHYWTPMTDDDPWNAVKWTSDLDGRANNVLLVQSGYDLASSIGHAVVVHDSNNKRIACGVIGKSPCEAFCEYNMNVCGTASYDDYDVCKTTCDTMPRGTTGKSREEGENSLACRLFQTSEAEMKSDLSTYCPLASADGGGEYGSGGICIPYPPQILMAETSRTNIGDVEINLKLSKNVNQASISSSCFNVTLNDQELEVAAFFRSSDTITLSIAASQGFADDVTPHVLYSGLLEACETQVSDFDQYFLLDYDGTAMDGIAPRVLEATCYSDTTTCDTVRVMFSEAMSLDASSNDTDVSYITLSTSNFSAAGESFAAVAGDDTMADISLAAPGVQAIGQLQLEVTMMSMLMDVAGNALSMDVTLNAQYINTNGPSIAMAATADLDGNGKVDAVMIKFDRPVTDATVAAGDFSAQGYVVEGWDTGDVDDDDMISLLLTEGAAYDTDVTIPVTLAAGNLVDRNNYATKGDSATAMDGAPPILLEFKTVNGRDSADLVFSESISTFSVSDMGQKKYMEMIRFINQPDPRYIYNAAGDTFSETDTLLGNTVLLTFRVEGGKENTVTEADMTEASVEVPEGIYKDAAGLFSPAGQIVKLTSSDTVAPRITSASAQDTFADSKTYATRLVVAFTEPIMAGSGGMQGFFTLKDASGAAIAITAIQQLGNKPEYEFLLEDLSEGGTNSMPEFMLSYAGPGIADAAGLGLEAFSDFEVADEIPPVITQIRGDYQGGGRAIAIDFSEPITDCGGRDVTTFVTLNSNSWDTTGALPSMKMTGAEACLDGLCNYTWIMALGKEFLELPRQTILAKVVTGGFCDENGNEYMELTSGGIEVIQSNGLDSLLFDESATDPDGSVVNEDDYSMEGEQSTAIIIGIVLIVLIVIFTIVWNVFFKTSKPSPPKSSTALVEAAEADVELDEVEAGIRGEEAQEEEEEEVEEEEEGEEGDE